MNEENGAVAGTATPNALAKKTVKKKPAVKATVKASKKVVKKAEKKVEKKVRAKSDGPRMSKKDVLGILKELGGKSVPTTQLIAAAEKKGFKGDSVLHHVCQMRTMEPPMVTATKKGGRGTNAEEVSITKLGTAALKG